MALTAAQRAARRAQQQNRDRARNQNTGYQIAQYGADYAAGKVDASGKPITPPAVMPQPFDPGAAQAERQATWNIGIGGAEANWQRGDTAWSLGYDASGAFNASNPYSQAQLLQDNYKRSVTGTNTSMAAAGQLYSGARLNAQGRNDRLYAEGSSALRDQARRTYHGIDYGQLQTQGQNLAGVSDEQLAGLRRSIYGS